MSAQDDLDVARDSTVNDATSSSVLPGKVKTPGPPAYLLKFLKLGSARFSRPQNAAASSKYTKGPQWFDLHMHSDLQLKRVEVLSDLPVRLCQFLDNFLRRENPVYDILEATADTKFPDMDAIETMFDQNNTHSENSVAKGVQAQSINPCALVASTLLFNIPAWDRLLGCSERARDVKQSIAKADAFVFVDMELPNANAVLSPSDQANIKMLKECRLQNFLLYEFKNLNAGDLETLSAIVSQVGEFPYITCKGFDDCDRPDHLVEGFPAVTGHNVGPDARYNGLFSLPTFPSTPVDSAEVGDSVTTSLQGDSHDSALVYTSTVLEPIREEEIDGMSVNGVADRSTSAGPSSLSRAAATKGKTVLLKKKAKRVKGLRSSKHDTQGNSVTSRTKRAKQEANDHAQLVEKARHIIQQAWAELVYNDATFMVISSGNHEIIAMRQRATQTLYFSPVLHTTLTGGAAPHKSVITSLMMLAYCDAIDRAHQKRATPVDVSGLQSPYCLTFTHTGLINGTPQGKALVINETLFQLLRNATCMQCEIPSIYLEDPQSEAIYEMTECEPYKAWLHPFRSVYTKRPHRSPPTLRFTADKTHKLKHSGKTTLETQRGTRIVYYTLSRLDLTGTEVEFFTGNLIMKFSVGTNSSNRALQDEYKMYQRLREAGNSCFPEVFGYFQFEGSNVCALLMACAGMSLDFWLHKSPLVQRNVIGNGAAIKGALRSLHNSGWLHGDLKPSHIVISPKGNVSFIGVRLAVKYEEKKAMSQTAEYDDKLTPAGEMEILEQWISIDD